MCLALPGELLDREEGPGGLAFGRVRFGGVVQRVCLAYAPEAAPGAWLIVHAGFAIAVLDEAEARRTLVLAEER